MRSAGFKPIISAGERPQTYALDRAATGTGFLFPLQFGNFIFTKIFNWDSYRRWDNHMLESSVLRFKMCGFARIITDSAC